MGPPRGEPQDRERERRHGECRDEERAGVGRAALNARDEREGAEAEQQVTRPAEQAIERELRVRLGMQSIERGPDREIESEQREQLIEAPREARRPLAS